MSDLPPPAPTGSSPSAQKHRLPQLPRSRVAALAAVVLVMALCAFVLLRPDEFEQLGSLGYAGVFLSTLVGSGALVLPVPYLATIFLAGRSLDPVAVALVAGLAGALGELTGYLLGLSGRAVIGQKRWLERLAAWRGIRSFLVIVVASAIPNPVFDALGIAAGIIGIPAWQFSLATFLGKSVRFWVIAALGREVLSSF